MIVVIKTKPDFTTKDAKTTKFNNKNTETFVAFVVSNQFVNESTPSERRVC